MRANFSTLLTDVLSPFFSYRSVIEPKQSITVKKFFVCKLCLILIISFSALSVAEENANDFNIFQKLDRWVYDNIDVVGRKDEVTGRREINLTSVEQELKLGKQYFDQVVSEYQGKVLSHDDPRYKRVEEIFKRIISVSHFAQMDTPELAVIDDPLWNAFATTGGRTIFFTGLTESSTDEEIASVMGHEIAHSSLSHITERQWQTRVKTAFNRNKVQTGYEQAFNTISEEEADRLGVLYAALAGYDPYAASRLWEKREQADPTVYYGYRTHPASADRANQSRANALLVSQYFVEDEINPDWASILKCNSLYCPSQEDKFKGGEGGGVLGVLELTLNTALKNYEAKLEREKQEQEIAKQQAKDLVALETQPPDIDWHPSWVYQYRGYFQRFDNQDNGITFALTNDASIGNYYFFKDGQMHQGEMRFLGRDQSGEWFIYDFLDSFGAGRISFKESNNEVSGSICFLPDLQKCGGFKGSRQSAVQ